MIRNISRDRLNAAYTTSFVTPKAIWIGSPPRQPRLAWAAPRHTATLRDFVTKGLTIKSGGNAAASIIIAAGLALSGCGGLPKIPLPSGSGTTPLGAGESDGTILFRSGAIGGPGYVAADEPQAANVGRDILERGGSAADAAVAMGFTLSVTYPHAVGLGGGGLCLYKSVGGAAESISFHAMAPAGGGDIAVPGLVRGLALLQTRHGAMRWPAVVTPAERLALEGARVSRAYSDHLTAFTFGRGGDPALAPFREQKDGRKLAEGDLYQLVDLSATLAALRAAGPAEFYQGAIAAKIIEAVRLSGGKLSAADLSAYAPTQEPAQALALKGQTVYLAPARTGGGQLAAETLAASLDGKDASRSAFEAALRKLGAREIPAGDLGSTSVIAVDGRGNAAACAFTLNGAFGAERGVPGTGILLARNPVTDASGLSSALLAPMILTEGRDRLRLVIGAAAGADALVRAGEAIRINAGKSRGKVKEIAAEIAGVSDSSVNLIWCPGYAAQTADPCGASTDANGHGLALIAVD